MLDSIAALSAKDRKLIFDTTTQQGGIQRGEVVEKDFWVSWLLEKLFDQPKEEPSLIFKGGTSLSKCYQLIDRFSEDIDITIAKRDLGFLEPDEKILELGNKRRKRYLDTLLAATVETIKTQLYPRLKSAIHSTLKEGCKLVISDSNPGNVLFHYPSCYHEITNQYLLPHVLLEFGSRGDIVPIEKKQAISYVESALPQLNIQSFVVNVLLPERTFWEKIMILHKTAHQMKDKPIKDRLSRHYYDVAMLAKKGILEKALSKTNLLEDVRLHNMAYYRSKSASFDTTAPGTFQLLPSSHYINALEEDYNRMQSMFMTTPPNFSDLVNAIRGIETKLNRVEHVLA